eukprot:7947855-Prorocentrum_lima.AAC.1
MKRLRVTGGDSMQASSDWAGRDRGVTPCKHQEHQEIGRDWGVAPCKHHGIGRDRGATPCKHPENARDWG